MSKGRAMEPEVKAARAIYRALDGLDVEPRSKALHLALGPREATDRLPRYKMALEAAREALAYGHYPSAAAIIKTALGRYES